MDATVGINVTVRELIATGGRIFSLVVRDDTNSIFVQAPGPSADFLAFDLWIGQITVIAPGTVALARRTGGQFDSVNFNATAFNRGWLTIDYVVL